MKRALESVLFGLIFLASTNNLMSQTGYRNLSIGASAGKGYGIDMSYGKRDQSPDGHDHGWDLAFSLWTPEYRIPILTDNTPTASDNDFLEGAYFEESKDVTFGAGLGVRYVLRPVAFGGMFDLVLSKHTDYYHNPVENSRSQIREDKTLGGWTGTVSLDLIDKLTLNGFYGTRRGLNLGLAWNIANP